MKTIFRFLALAMLVTAFSAASVTTSFAQDPLADKTALYKIYTDNYSAKEHEKRQLALDAAKSYVEKYGTNKEDEEQVNYFKKAIPDLEKGITKQKEDVANAGKKAARDKIINRFSTAVTASKTASNPANLAETFAASKETLALNDENTLDVLLVISSIGYDQASAKTPVDTYNDDTINYSKMAIQKLEANTASANKKYGALGYEYLNKENTDGKNNALNWMNYNIGYILYYRQGKDNPAKKKEALPYFYKATKYTSSNQKNPTPYQAIGAWYLDEAIRIDKERQVKLAANGNKDNEETLAMVGEQKGYADRAIDAYSRAYKLAKNNPKSDKTYTDSLYTRLKDLYAFRYDNKTTGIDEFVAKVDSTPFPDPTTPITPVKIETTEPATTTSGTTTPATTPATTKPPTTTPTPKPATTPPTTKPPTAGTTTTTGSTAETKPTATVKPTAKKPAPKKKGTR